jgi:hypothetical protein
MQLSKDFDPFAIAFFVWAPHVPVVYGVQREGARGEGQWAKVGKKKGRELFAPRPLPFAPDRVQFNCIAAGW